MRSLSPGTGSPITAIMRSPSEKNTAIASQIRRARSATSLQKPPDRLAAVRSYLALIGSCRSGASTMVCWSLRSQETARTWAVLRSSVRSGSGTRPSRRSWVASAASRAAVRRSDSQLMRKFATDGTKISTSASMTNSSVRSSSLAERPSRSLTLPSIRLTALTRRQSRPVQLRASSIMSRGTRPPRCSPRVVNRASPATRRSCAPAGSRRQRYNSRKRRAC